MERYNILYISNEKELDSKTLSLKEYLLLKSYSAEETDKILQEKNIQIIIVNENFFYLIEEKIDKNLIDLPVIILKKIERERSFYNYKNHHITILKSPYLHNEIRQALDNSLNYYKLKKENRILSSEISRLENREFSLLKKEVLNNLSHEIRTPLNAIIGFSNLLVSKNQINENNDYISIIEESSNRLINYIDNLSEFLRHDKTEDYYTFSHISLYHIFLSLSSIYGRYISRKNIILKLSDMPPCLQKIMIYSNKHKIISIFSRLISSAIYNANDGSISLGISKNQKRTICLEYTEILKTNKDNTLLGIMIDDTEHRNNSLDNELIEIRLIKRNIKQLNGNFHTKNDGGIYKLTIEIPFEPIVTLRHKIMNKKELS